MKISPYVAFSGQCTEAIEFYEQAFNAKATIMRYKDIPHCDDYEAPKGTEDFVVHGQIEIGGGSIMFSDAPPDYPVTVGDNITITVEFDNADQTKKIFDALKEGGKVSMEIQEAFWSKCCGSLTDKFGINWHVSTVE